VDMEREKRRNLVCRSRYQQPTEEGDRSGETHRGGGSKGLEENPNGGKIREIRETQPSSTQTAVTPGKATTSTHRERGGKE